MSIYPQFYPASLKTNLVSYWDLDANSTDYYGNNNGTDTSINYVTSNIIKGANFNGTNSKITFAGNSFDSKYFTVAGWINVSTYNINSGVALISNWDPNAQRGWMFYVATNGRLTLTAATDQGGGGVAPLASINTTTIPLNTWVHAAVTVNWNVVKVYYNASGVSTTQLGPIVFGNNYGALGARRGTSFHDYLLYGTLDEFGYWNRVLTDEEIIQLYSYNKNFQLINGSSSGTTSIVSASNMTDVTNLGSGTTGTNTSIVSADLTVSARFRSNVTASATVSASLTTQKLFVSSVTATASTSATLSVPLFWRTNLVSYWEFQNNANDYYGNNNGTATNLTYTTGKLGNAGVFNGSTTKISLGTGYNRLNYSTFSAGGWIYPTQNRYGNIITSWNQTNLTGWKLRLTSGGKLEFEYGNSGNVSVGSFVTTANINLNTWTHVLLTVTSGNTFNFYINGVLDRTLNSAFTLGYGSTTTYSLIGANPMYGAGEAEFFMGNMDQIGFWSRALTALEASYLYNSYTPIGLQADVSAGAISSANLRITAKLFGIIDANSVSQAALTTALRFAGDINSNSIFSDAELITNIKLLGDINSTSDAENAYLTTTCFIDAQPIQAFASSEGSLDTQISLNGEILGTSEAVSSQMESIVTTHINDLVYETQLIAYKLAKFVQGFNVNSQNITNLSQGTLASDAINVDQLIQVSGALKNYIDEQDLDFTTNLNSVSGSIIDYVDAADDLLDTAINNLSSSIVNYIDVADNVLNLAMSELSNSLKAYADARNDVLNQNINNVSSSLKQYVDLQDGDLQNQIVEMSGNFQTYVDYQDVLLSASIAQLSNSAANSLITESAVRAQEDTNFVKLDGSRTLTGNLNVSGNDITNAGSGTLAGDLTIQGNLQVNGELMRVNKLDVRDNLVTISKGASNGNQANGAGIYVDGANVSFTYDSASNKWISNIGLNVNTEAGFDAAIKLSGSTFTNITTVVTNNKYNLSNAIHDLDVAIKDQATRVSDTYDSIRLIVVGQIVDGSAAINLTLLGGAQFATSELDNISLDVLISEDGTSYTDNFVSSKIYMLSNNVNVLISSPAVLSGYYRLIAINQKKGAIQ